MKEMLPTSGSPATEDRKEEAEPEALVTRSTRQSQNGSDKASTTKKRPQFDPFPQPRSAQNTFVEERLPIPNLIWEKMSKTVLRAQPSFWFGNAKAGVILQKCLDK